EVELGDAAVAPDLLVGRGELDVRERVHRALPAGSVAAVEQPAPAARAALLGADLGQDLRPGRVDDILGFVEERGDVVAVQLEVDRLIGRLWSDEGAVAPVDVDE